MSYQSKGLRSARDNSALSDGEKVRAARRKAARRPAWRRTWIRVLLIVGVVFLPLLAAGVAGPAIRGGSSWRGLLSSMRLTTNGEKRSDGCGDSGDSGGTDCNGSGKVAGGRADFGQLSVKLFNPITRSRLQADFQLEGVAVLEDGKKLETIVKNKYRFIREQATIAVRNSSNAELADPKLKMLQRRILIRINRSLERPLLKSIDLKHFMLSEATPELDLMGEDGEQSQ